MNTVVLTFKKYVHAELSNFTFNVIQRMSTDARFTTLKPHVDTLKTNYDAYMNAAALAVDGGKDRTLEKNIKLETMVNQLVIIARYVEILAGDNELTILAAGFETRKASKVIAELSAPAALSVINVEKSGSIRLNWENVPGALNFAIENLVKGETAWKNGKYSSTKETILNGYEPGTYVEFRIRALGRRGLESDWTAPVGVWIA